MYLIWIIKIIQLKFFFNKNDLNLIGWEIEDIYQNIVQTFISDIQKNISVDNKIFVPVVCRNRLSSNPLGARSPLLLESLGAMLLRTSSTKELLSASQPSSSAPGGGLP